MQLIIFSFVMLFFNFFSYPCEISFEKNTPNIYAFRMSFFVCCEITHKNTVPRRISGRHAFNVAVPKLEKKKSQM